VTVATPSPKGEAASLSKNNHAKPTRACSPSAQAGGVGGRTPPQETPRNIKSPSANTIFGPFFGVPVTSFSRPLCRNVTELVRVYATSKNKRSLLATFCSRILLIWQYTSVIFRNSQLFWGVRETCRSQLSHFENSEYWMQPRPSGSGSRPSQELARVLTRTGKVFTHFARVARFPCSSKGDDGVEH